MYVNAMYVSNVDSIDTYIVTVFVYARLVFDVPMSSESDLGQCAVCTCERRVYFDFHRH